MVINYSFIKMELTKGKILEKYDHFSDHWHPRIIAELNGQAVKIAKIKGEFPMHFHEHEDEMFYVVKGEMKIRMNDEEIILCEGEYIVIPRGVPHQPSAKEETYILMFEPIETINTGNMTSKLTREKLDKI